MKSYKIEFPDDLLTRIYRMTANAAMLRGDGKFSATEDDVDILNQFKKDGEVILNNALGKYGLGALEYSMPGNWNYAKEINDLASAFMVEYITTRWMALGGNEVAQPVIDLMPILGKRVKP